MRASGLVLVGSLLGRSFEALSHVVLARGLGPRAYGLYVVALEGALAISALARGGLDSAALVLIPRHQAEGRLDGLQGVVAWSLLLPGAAGLVLAAGVGGMAPTLAARWNLPVWVLLLAVLMIPLHALLITAGTATRGFQVVLPQLVVLNVAYPGAKLLLVLALLGWGLLGALGATVLAAGLAAALATGWLLRLAEASSRGVPPIPGLGSPGVKTLAVTAWPLFLGDLLSLGLLRASPLILAAFRPPQEVGVYGVALQASRLFLLIGEAAVALAAPRMAWHWARGERAAVLELLGRSRAFALALGLPGLAGFVLAGRWGLSLLGPAYRGGYEALLLLGVGHALAASLAGAGWGLLASGRTTLWLTALALAGLGQLVLSVLLIPSFGIVGAALAQAGGLAGLYLAAWHQMQRRCYAEAVSSL